MFRAPMFVSVSLLGMVGLGFDDMMYNHNTHYAVQSNSKLAILAPVPHNKSTWVISGISWTMQGTSDNLELTILLHIIRLRSVLA